MLLFFHCIFLNFLIVAIMVVKGRGGVVGKKWRVFGLTTVILAVTVIALPEEPARGDEQVNPVLYKDVPLESSHFQNIMEARTLGLMTGYPDSSFKPSEKLNRANVVKAFGKYIERTSGKTVDEFDLSDIEPFVDVPANARDQELFMYSLLVKKEGVFKGSQNRLLASDEMTRRQMAMVLTRAFDLQDLPGAESKVTDIDPSFGEEDKRAIRLLSEHQITTVTEFRPRETTSRGQFASFIVASYHAVHDEFPPPEVVSVQVIQ